MRTDLLACSAFALAVAAATPAAAQQAFNRIASFPVFLNIAEGGDRSVETAPEIIDASADGMTLVYTDSPLQALGFVDISDPATPAPGGTLALDGEPTAVT
ncbi:MAG: alkaline phosphatase, partial [Pseudomonadota bacterium]